MEQNTQSTQLNLHLNKYKDIEQKGGWKKIEAKEMRIGMVDPCIGNLRNRLSITGDLISTRETVSDTFDIFLETAVKQFQKKHHIPITGKVDKKTIYELNISCRQRIRQIELNIKRWENSEIETKNLYIFVNIAAGELSVIENDSIIMDMKIIVGRLSRKTPVFNAELTSIEINPYWIVPPGIMKKDILPKIYDDPDFIKNNDMSVFAYNKKIDPETITEADTIQYKIVQNPGPNNSMGVVKFNFPNRYYVYMHDTPSKELFERSSNTFSSGCIRLSKAKELAIYILNRDKGLSSAEVDSIIKTKKNNKISLNNKVRIHIAYFTAWVNKKGELEFAPDIYRRDY